MSEWRGMSEQYTALKRITMVIVFVIIAMAGTMIYSFFASGQAHRHRIEFASATFQGYSKDQWKKLFEEVKTMVAKNPGAGSIPQNQWLPTIATLRPYHVSRSAGEVTMHWTGGFDDDYLSLSVDLGAGVFLYDSTGGNDVRGACVWAVP